MNLSGAVVARPVRLAQAVVVLLLALKLWLTLTAPPIGDEAYYWMWGQKPGWSYLDHPPLHAWLLGLMSVFGWNHFALRLLTWLSFGGTLWIFRLWAQRLKPADPGAWFWPAAAIYLATPLFFLMSSIAFHDHLLIFLAIASAHAFLTFAEKWEETGRGWAWLYGGAVLLGLAVLTKYNGVLLGVGFALFFLVVPKLRRLWLSPHLYLAALLAVALQAPVLWWNLDAGLASFNFHLAERWGRPLLQFQPGNFVRFVITTLVVVSPFLFPPLGRLLLRPPGTPFADRARALALSVFAVSSLAMVGLSLFVEVFFYWNILAFLLLMPLVAGWFRHRWGAALHYGYGIFGAVLLTVNFSVVPVGNIFGFYDWTSSSSYGWEIAAPRVEALKRAQGADFVVAARYTTAAQLGYAMHDADVVTIADRHDQYDYWFDPAVHAGETAIIVSDSELGLGEIAPFFESVTPLEDISFDRFGIHIYTAQIYLGRGFTPAQRAE